MNMTDTIKTRLRWLLKVWLACLCITFLGGMFTADAEGRQLIAPSGDFCTHVKQHIDKPCRARYSCADQQNIDRLAAATCTCLQGGAAPSQDNATLTQLLAETPEFACCAGTALAANPHLCQKYR